MFVMVYVYKLKLPTRNMVVSLVGRCLSRLVRHRYITQDRYEINMRDC